MAWRAIAPSAFGSIFSQHRYKAEHFTSALEVDWSVNTPGTAMQVFESGLTTRLLSVDSSYRSITKDGYTGWYPDQRLHLLTRTGSTARLADTLRFSAAQVGDVVGDAKRLFLNVRPAYWYAYAQEGVATAGEARVSTTSAYEDTLFAVDISAGKLDVRSSSTIGTYGSQLMGLRGDRLFVNLPGDGVVVVDVSHLESLTATHFVRTLGWATHVAFTATRAFVASGSFGIFEVALDGEPTIGRL